MAIDPGISLQAQAPQIDLASIYGTAMQLRQMRDDMQFNNSLKQILSAQPALNPDGTTNANTLAQIARLGPKGLAYATDLNDKAAQVQEREAQTAKARSETTIDNLKAGHETLTTALDTYDAATQGGTDPVIAENDLKSQLHDFIYKQPISDQSKAAQYQALAGMNPQQLRAAAGKMAMTIEERQAAEKPQIDFTPGGQPIEITPKIGGGLDVRTASGQPYEGGVQKTPGGAPRFYQDDAGDMISFRNGQWKNETTGEPLADPPANLHTVTSGAARSAPAMALQAYMRSPAYRDLPDDQKPEALAQFNAGFHNVQIGGTASAKADQSSLTNITKIADASEAFEHTAMANFDQALRLAPKGIKTNMGPLIERFIQDPEKALGDPGVPAYQAALLTAANEYAKVIAGSTGSQGSTVDSRREAAEMFSSLYNTDQIEGVISVAKRDMDNKIASYAGQREGIRTRIEGETGVSAGGQPAAGGPKLPAGAAYHSPQDVYNAVHSGKITKAQGVKLLQDDFGYR